MTESILVARDIRKGFPSRGAAVRVLEGLSLEVERGSRILITGKSGSGKSTLLSLLAGLDRPDSGSVQFEGRRLESLSNEDLARLRGARMGFIFQDYNLLPAWTALENVEAVLMHRGIGALERREKARDLLASLGLADRLGHLPGELSAGQRQRVAVARSLANDPAMLFADEPTAEVDPETGAEIAALLLESVQRLGATLVVASHGGFPLEGIDRRLALRGGLLTEEP